MVRGAGSRRRRGGATWIFREGDGTTAFDKRERTSSPRSRRTARSTGARAQVIVEIEKKSSGWLYSVSYDDVTLKVQDSGLPGDRVRTLGAGEELEKERNRASMKSLDDDEDDDDSKTTATHGSSLGGSTVDPTAPDFVGYRVGSAVEVWHPAERGEAPRAGTAGIFRRRSEFRTTPAAHDEDASCRFPAQARPRTRPRRARPRSGGPSGRP